MALETVVYPLDPFVCGLREFFAGDWGCGYGLEEHEQKVVTAGTWDSNCPEQGGSNGNNIWDSWSSSPEANRAGLGEGSRATECPGNNSCVGRRKRRRTKTCKNKEEMENQRRTHIAVERNRRKQMNEYLAAIRSMMPPSYVQRTDQASIIGGAINFVKELEYQLQTMEAYRKGVIITNQQQHSNTAAGFFTFRQTGGNSPAAENRSELFGEIEVRMAERHANLKIVSKKRPRQILKIVAGLQCMWLTVLHLNVTSVDQTVLYSLNVKLEDGCQLTTVDEIADAVNHLLGRIQEDAALIS